MKIIDELADLARTRPEQLRACQAKGQKLVGYTGRFVPEELIRAAGAIDTMNRMRQLLGYIGRFRRQAAPPISGSEVIRLHHLSFQLDDEQLCDVPGVRLFPGLLQDPQPVLPGDFFQFGGVEAGFFQGFYQAR